LRRNETGFHRQAKFLFNFFSREEFLEMLTEGRLKTRKQYDRKCNIFSELVPLWAKINRSHAHKTRFWGLFCECPANLLDPKSIFSSLFFYGLVLVKYECKVSF